MSVRSGTNCVIDPNIGVKVYITKAKHEDELFVVTFYEDGSGVFYGNTDLFDQAREGSRVGFFAVPIQQLKRDSVSMSFKVSVCENDIYSDIQYPNRQHGKPYINASPLLKPYKNRCFSALISGKVSADSLVLSIDHAATLMPNSEPNSRVKLTLYALPQLTN